MGKFTSCSSNTYCCGDCDCLDSNQLYIIPGRNDAFTTVGDSSVNNETVGSPPLPSPSSTYNFLTQSVGFTAPATSTAEAVDSTSVSGNPRDFNSKKKVIGVSASLGSVIVVFVLIAVWKFWRRHKVNPSDAYRNAPMGQDMDSTWA